MLAPWTYVANHEAWVLTCPTVLVLGA